LILPKGSNIPIKKILVPVDFSEDSELTLKRVGDMARRIKAELLVEHVYMVPTGYTKTGKTFEEFGQIMLKHAKGHMHKFLKDCEMSHFEDRVIYRLDNGHDPSDEIMEAAEDRDVDLIVLGARGRSDPAAFLLGSLAEKLVQRDYSIPVLVEKNKRTVMKFLEALLQV